MHRTAPTPPASTRFDTLVELAAAAKGDGGRWRSDGLCAGVDPDVFFPDRGVGPAPAKRICGRCPVQQECLNDALARRESHGIWGATTANERRAILTHRRQR